MIKSFVTEDYRYFRDEQNYTLNKFSYFTIKMNQKKIRWDILCRSQQLHERLIEEFQHLVDWKIISRYQKLSNAFITKHMDKLCLTSLSENKNIDQEFVEKLALLK